MKKGVGSTISAILIIIVLLFFFYIFMATATTSSQKKLELNLNTADFLKVKNSVSILNRSLATTWFVSTVQLLFRAGDESVGCGYDDYFTEGVDVAKKGYWYQYTDTKQPKASQPLQFEPSASGQNKYNIKTRTGNIKEIVQPVICYPIEQHLLGFVKEKSALYKDLQRELELNSIKFALNILNLNFVLRDGALVSEATQEISANVERANPKIVTTTKNTNTIFTGFKSMLAAGRKIVENAIQDSKDVEARTSQLLYSGTESAYKSRVRNHLESRYASVLPADKFRVSSTQTIEVRAGDDEEVGFRLDKQGLVLHYDADIVISEQEKIISTACAAIKQEFLDRIGIEVGEHGWSFLDIDIKNRRSINTIAYTNEEIVNLVSAMIQKESGQNVRAVSKCGAAGLMQLMPGTAKSPPLTIPVIFEDAGFVSCDRTGYADRLRAAINGKSDDEIKSIDGRLDPVQSIRKGVQYTNFLFTQFKDYTSDKAELMKLVVAAYNTGPGNVRSTINTAKSVIPGFDEEEVKYEQIKGFLPADETRNHVTVVTHLFACYEGGGLARAATYPWPTQSREITSCFGLRDDPVSGERRAHEGIDIAAEKGADVVAAASGEVVEISKSCTEGAEECGGRYGNFVKIRHDDGYFSFYGHLKEGSLGNLDIGSKVLGGKIAEVGSTGKSTGSHLHFEVLQGSKPLNPCNFVDCSQSTGKQCTGEIDPSLIEGLYYYHDEKQNTFTPRSFALNLRVEDNLNVLDCKRDLEGDPKDPKDDEPFRILTWVSGQDMACCGGAVWTCKVPATGENNFGNHALQPPDAVSSEACIDAVTKTIPPDQENPKQYSLGCTEQGFKVVEV